MQIIKTHYHPEIETLENKSIFTRLATRSIAIQGESILLLYTTKNEEFVLFSISETSPLYGVFGSLII